MIILPEQFQKNIANLYGDKGKKWLTDLPSLLIQCASQLDIKVEPAYPNLSFHYVAPVVMSNGQKAVLKCSVPDQSLRKEALALQHFNGQGCVKLYNINNDAGIMLLEKADPGITLETIQDEKQACIIAVDLMRELHKPSSQIDHFDTLHQWFSGLNNLKQLQGKGLLSDYLVDKAISVSQELLATMKSQVLLHGDLHYANILSSKEHGWISIDPKGVVGEPEFEIPLPRLGEKLNKTFVQINIDLFVDISGFDRQRIIGWLFSKAVLAAWWSYEDNGEIWQPFIECAEIINQIR